MRAIGTTCLGRLTICMLIIDDGGLTMEFSIQVVDRVARLVEDRIF